MAFCIAVSEEAFGTSSSGDLVELELFADMVELMILSGAASLSWPPAKADWMDVVVGVDVVVILWLNEEDLVGFGVGFESSAGWYAGEPTAVSVSALQTPVRPDG